MPASCCNLWDAGQADPSNATAWPEMESACFIISYISSESNLIGPVKRMQVVPNFTTWKNSTCLPPWTSPSPQQCEPSSVKDSCADLRPTCKYLRSQDNARDTLVPMEDMEGQNSSLSDIMPDTQATVCNIKTICLICFR
jgi:hypothetical protein